MVGASRRAMQDLIWVRLMRIVDQCEASSGDGLQRPSAFSGPTRPDLGRRPEVALPPRRHELLGAHLVGE